MTPTAFDEFYERGQHWLSVHGKPTDDRTTLDITRTYVKQQLRAKFVVLD